ncbi:BrnA antitoxin family protein [Brucella intermedia]|uniref:BrnA antitoxin family protein n=1 Tax=Brucella intermedia TaxID=94625 RepID=UPI00124CC54B|nr:BrnA antitoxin family protein [Brucella intermedia]KAB2692520.1 BrnA antitoxin family protein [Brucella intermedia]
MAIRIISKDTEPATPKPKPQKKAAPAPMAIPAEAEKRGRGRPSSGKTMVTIRLDPDIVEAFKAKGKGWQPLMNEALRKAAGL